MIVFSLGYYDGPLQTILHDLKFKSLKQGVLAYNMGESTIREYRYYKAEPPSGFYNKVVGNYRMLKSKYGDAVQ